MDADVLYDPVILEPLAQGRGSLFLLDRDFDDEGGEAVKLCVRGRSLVDFRKVIAPSLRYDYAGESVGFFRFSEPVAKALADRCEAHLGAGRSGDPYEEVIRDLLLHEPDSFSFVDVTGVPWIEIDFPRDLERARVEILPLLPDRR
jgi:choline kinase